MNLHEEISKVAYELYEKGGRLGGLDVDNWLEAEKIVRTRQLKEKNEDEVIKSINMNYTGEEKRKHKRFTLKWIQRNFPHSVNSRIINISIGGVAIETTKKLEINKEYSLNINYKGNPLKLKCRALWSLLTREEKIESGDIIRIYKGGMKFHRSLLMNTLSNTSK